ncbi:hypothetical protein [Hymenobacter swuensis]|uniref:Uncharacterized protein n=1 Tax=Hymenobacter swuensis DY53 TaxID=1227739 RepID=W8F0M6_9BACT|nr:hypothetical protein [Hymenobacter swuensis]AHJ97572.1 hypothetical protein Hsw_1977 [Hymenobacter swuensis DY53]
MKKLLFWAALLLAALWLGQHLLPPALPVPPHLAAVPVVRKPYHPPPQHPKRVTLPGKW